MADDPIYNLKLSPEHARIVVAALDLYSRIGMGQFEEIPAIFRLDRRIDRDQLDTVRQLVDAIKETLFQLPPNASFSICSEKDVLPDYRTAYDIECVLRQQVATIEKHHKMSVWHGDPLHTNKDIPLVKCEVIFPAAEQTEDELADERKQLEAIEQTEGKS
ncbi:MAG: hypothetical protein CMB80_01020 [Flammeovirgaceae bacterium]|nr:hypothetical protein [Flammeovirgaceae bacterium]|tara:strand:+ start:4017 stop:4499 length:483 start_codon:yes stop_codon:yes gene_type:complete